MGRWLAPLIAVALAAGCTGINLVLVSRCCGRRRTASARLYRTWAEGGPFPSALAVVPEGRR